MITGQRLSGPADAETDDVGPISKYVDDGLKTLNNHQLSLNASYVNRRLAKISSMVLTGCPRRLQITWFGILVEGYYFTLQSQKFDMLESVESCGKVNNRTSWVGLGDLARNFDPDVLQVIFISRQPSQNRLCDRSHVVFVWSCGNENTTSLIQPIGSCYDSVM